MKNACPFMFYIVFQVLEVLFMKICKIKPPYLLFLVVFISFSLADIISHKFLGLHPTSEKKKDFCHNFSFFRRSQVKITVNKNCVTFFG